MEWVLKLRRATSSLPHMSSTLPLLLHLLLATSSLPLAASRVLASPAPPLPWPVPTHFTMDAAAPRQALAPGFTVSVAGGAGPILTAAAARYTAIINNSTPAPPPPPQCDWEHAAVPCKVDGDCAAWITANCHPASAVAGYCRGNHFCHLSGSFSLSAAEEEASRGAAATTVGSLVVTVGDLSNETLGRITDGSYTLTITPGAGKSDYIPRSPTVTHHLKHCHEASRNQPMLCPGHT